VGPLGENLVVCPDSRTCSTGIWSFSLPRRLARQRLGRSPRFTDLLDGDLVIGPTSYTHLEETCTFALAHRLAWKMGRKEVMGLTWGTPFLGT
jgi:hypothetical protein